MTATCGVQYSVTDGVCTWCRQPKAAHGALRVAVRVFRCTYPGCAYQFWDATFDDANAHWDTHVAKLRAEAHQAGVREERDRLERLYSVYAAAHMEDVTFREVMDAVDEMGG